MLGASESDSRASGLGIRSHARKFFPRNLDRISTFDEDPVMSSPQKLDKAEIEAAIQALSPAWKLNTQGRLEAEFRFKTFPEAFSFMTRIAFEAERMDHHPDWFNSYNRVKIELMTHDAGCVTEKDLVLARKISAISWIPSGGAAHG